MLASGPLVEQNDTVPHDQLEQLETVAGEIAQQVRRHLPNPFMVNHRVTITNSRCVILTVQAPMGVTMEVVIQASELEELSPPSDGTASDDNSIETAFIEITAAVVKQMQQTVDVEAIKTRPAS